jgi:hypothetical protein
MIPAIEAATASPTGSEGTHSTVDRTTQDTGSSVAEAGLCASGRAFGPDQAQNYSVA